MILIISMVIFVLLTSLLAGAILRKNHPYDYSVRYSHEWKNTD